MSKDLKNNSSEEIDIIQLFNFFEDKTKAFLYLIFRALRFIYEILISFFKTIQQYFIILFSLVTLAVVLGFIYDSYKPKEYSSTMMVKPMFQSKYQLFSNIDYYNALIVNGESDKLASLFKISKTEAINLKSFKMAPGPENENEKIIAYDEFIKSVDSSTAKMIDYDQFIEHMSIYNSSIYEITVKSSQKDIFSKLAPGFEATFNTKFSNSNKEKNTELYKLKKKSLEKQITELDSLQKMYVRTLSKKQSKQVSVVGGTPLIIGEEDKNTKEFESFELRIKLQTELNQLEKVQINNREIFSIISDFPSLGTTSLDFKEKMKFIFPLFTFLFSLLIIFGIKFNKYIKNYKLN